MSNELATSPPSDTIEFSNVTVVRDQEGTLSIYVGKEKVLGVMGANISQGALGLAIPMSRVRLAEATPATPVLETKNVVSFKNFQAAKLALSVDNTEPTTDGDSQ